MAARHWELWAVWRPKPRRTTHEGFTVRLREGMGAAHEVRSGAQGHPGVPTPSALALRKPRPAALRGARRRRRPLREMRDESSRCWWRSMLHRLCLPPWLPPPRSRPQPFGSIDYGSSSRGAQLPAIAPSGSDPLAHLARLDEFWVGLWTEPIGEPPRGRPSVCPGLASTRSHPRCSLVPPLFATRRAKRRGALDLLFAARSSRC